jgi:hypothetical protein
MGPFHNRVMLPNLAHVARGDVFRFRLIRTRPQAGLQPVGGLAKRSPPPPPRRRNTLRYCALQEGTDAPPASSPRGGIARGISGAAWPVGTRLGEDARRSGQPPDRDHARHARRLGGYGDPARTLFRHRPALLAEPAGRARSVQGGEVAQLQEDRAAPGGVTV